MGEQVRLPVRMLTDFLLRSGSIDNRFGGDDRAAEGSRIHRQLQKEEGPGYQSEVFLSLSTVLDGVTYSVEGRADGVFTGGDGETVIDEIKTTAHPLESIGEDFDRAHWGQAMCYAYFLAARDGLDRIGVRLRYYQVDTQSVLPFYRSFSIGELKDFFEDLLRRYSVWTGWQARWRETRDASVSMLPFPFGAYRPGQRELSVAAYRTIERGGRLFAQAPTGIGKTMSTLFPAVKALGAGKAEKIFYLTAKTISRRSALDALARLASSGLRLKSAALTAKDKICLIGEPDCNPDSCPYADGYYDRVNDVVFSLLEAQDTFTREILEETARRERVCPFELSLDLTLWCDAVICDYNYLFDPVAKLQRFFGEEGGNYVFLIDEAHNLVERSREMYSAELGKTDFSTLCRQCGNRHPALRRAAGQAEAAMDKAGIACGEADDLACDEVPADLFKAVARFNATCSEWLSGHRASPIRREVLGLYFKTRFFARIAELYDAHYVTLVVRREDGPVCQLLCLDPCAFINECLSMGCSAVLFSATFSPAAYYASVLGGADRAKKLVIPSPFPPERLCVLTADRVSTRYADREKSLSDVAGLLCAFAGARCGNYLFFFPSYPYMRAVYEAFCGAVPYPADTIIQESGMDEAAREAFLDRFSAQNSRTLAGFCVLGGIYSEGIDLKGERLIGTAVVGVGLPQISTRLNLLRQYYDRANGMGFEYAYRYPGMNKVLQAGGRVIRGESDRGALLLVDDRFTQPAYRGLLPAHWSHCRAVRNPAELSDILSDFWDAPLPGNKSGAAI